MKPHSLLDQFLDDGSLGPISLGLSRDAVSSILGDAFATYQATRRRDICAVLDLELSFFKGHLDILTLRIGHSGVVHLPRAVFTPGQVDVGSTDYSEWVSHLSHRSDGYRVNELDSRDGMTCLEVPSGVRLYFVSDRLTTLVQMSL